MEIVNTSLVPAAEAVEFLLRGGGLARMIGTDACACFVVSREISAPNFFDHLIRHVETIDSTTREHIAFIVFYGDSSRVLARAGGSYKSYQYTQAILESVSFTRQLPAEFDETYAELFRTSPETVDRSAFATHMTRSTDALMETFALRESDLPSAIFVDPINTEWRWVISLQGSDPMRTLYSRVLAPLADAFRDLRSWLDASLEVRNAAARHQAVQRAASFLETEAEKEARLGEKIGSIERKIAEPNELQEARSELRRVEAELKSLAQAADVASSPSRELARAQLEDKRYKYRQRICTLESGARRNDLEKALAESHQRLKDFVVEKENQQRILQTRGASPEEVERVFRARTKDSLARGYDWPTLHRLWPGSWPQGPPRAYGVVEHVLARLAGSVKAAVVRVGQTIEYDVALSFAGEDRADVDRVANALTKRNIRVFRYDEADSWGKNLYEYLAEVYGEKAHFCLLFVSASYATKRWTIHERRHAQERAFLENREYILPVRLDDTELPGFLKTIAYLDLRRITPDEVADAVAKKLGMLASASA